MGKSLLRFALVWAVAALLTPYVNRLLTQMASRGPRDSLVTDVLLEISDQYSTGFIRSFGEALAEILLGSKKR